MPFDDSWEGEGTLKEYFTHTPYENIDDPSWTPEFRATIKEMDDGTEEREVHLDRLQLQLFTEFSGLAETDTVKAFWPETLRQARQKSKRKGLIIVGWQPDDPIIGLYKDGQPIAAFYASYRGAYQAGGYIHATGQEFFAHNAFTEEYAGPMNTWQERSNICADIARGMLLGERKH